MLTLSGASPFYHCVLPRSCISSSKFLWLNHWFYHNSTKWHLKGLTEFSESDQCLLRTVLRWPAICRWKSSFAAPFWLNSSRMCSQIAAFHTYCSFTPIRFLVQFLFCQGEVWNRKSLVFGWLNWKVLWSALNFHSGRRLFSATVPQSCTWSAANWIG